MALNNSIWIQNTLLLISSIILIIIIVCCSYNNQQSSGNYTAHINKFMPFRDTNQIIEQ